MSSGDTMQSKRDSNPASTVCIHLQDILEGVHRCSGLSSSTLALPRKPLWSPSPPLLLPAPSIPCLALRMPRRHGPLCSMHCHTARPVQWGGHHSPHSLSQPVTGPPAGCLYFCVSLSLRETAASLSVCSLFPYRVCTL